MAKENAWAWVLGGVVVLYAIGANARAQQAAAVAAGTTTPAGGISSWLQNLFGGSSLAPASSGSGMQVGTLPGGGFYNPSLPNYQPVNYNYGGSSTSAAGPTPNAVPLGNSGGGLTTAGYAANPTSYFSPGQGGPTPGMLV